MGRRVTLALALVVILAMATPGLLSAQQPQFPALYWGTATIYGPGGEIDAPVGTVITAEVYGVEKGSLTVTEAGKYGDHAEHRHLLVQGNIVPNSPIVFLANGYVADETSTFQEGEPEELDLTIEDSVPPTTPANLTRTTPDNDNTPTFTWDAASDVLAGVEGYGVRIDDGGWVPIGNVLSWTSPDVVPGGSHTFYVKARDKVGNEGVPGSLAFTVDTVPPTVTIIPLTPDPTMDNTPTLTGTATDTVSPIASVEYRVDGGGWLSAQPVDGTFDELVEEYTFTIAALVDGDYTVEVKATDSAGNVTAEPDYASDSFTVDTGAPAITITPLTPDPTNDNTPTFTGTAMDDDVSIASVEYRVDGGGWLSAQPVDGTFDELVEDYTFTIAALVDGDYTVEVRATDAAANTTAELNYASDTFTVDTGVPSVTLIPLSPDPTNDNTPTFTGTATDPASTWIASVEYRVDGGGWLPAQPVDGAFDSASEDYTFTTAALDDGEHTVEVRATDAASNITAELNYASDTFTLDTIAPVIANWAPTGTIADIRPTISADYSDAFTGIDIASVVLTLDGDDVTTWSTVTATGVSSSLAKALAEGSHTIELSVSDLAGNEATQGWSFTISVPPPPPPEEVEELSPEEAADVLEELPPDEVAKVLEEVSTKHVADILGEMSAKVAGEVMEEMSTEKLTDTVSEMSEESLTERLPELSAEKLYEIPPEVLFEALPNAPTEQLVGEEPPVPPPGLEAPTVFETPTGVRYLVIRTEAGEWAIIVGTPEPLTKIMVKVKRELADIETLVEVLDTKPAGIVAELPAQQLVNTYVRITVQNIPPEDIIGGHLAFQVEKDWMETNEIHKWSVVLYRYDEQLKLWIPLPTKRVDEDESHVYYTAVTQKFSAFAIAGSGTVPTIGFEASNITISPDEVIIGEQVSISADITSLSTEDGGCVIALWINNTVEEVREITVAANGTETVSFTVVRDEEDTYNVRIDRLMGSFAVWAVLPSKPTPMWLYAVAVVGGLIVLSAVVFAVVWLRRRPVGVR